LRNLGGFLLEFRRFFIIMVVAFPWRSWIDLGAPTELMSKLQTPKHDRTRRLLRLAGPIIALAGLIFLIIGVASFFSAFGGGGSPRLFWCCFVGLPLLFVGSVLCMFGFLGAVARYTAAEQVPVATDAINDLAEGTQGAVKTVARAVVEGAVEGIDEARKKSP
jgi:protein-S-isoprenylcysteine O-methyltransferase Ste14